MSVGESGVECSDCGRRPGGGRPALLTCLATQPDGSRCRGTLLPVVTAPVTVLEHDPDSGCVGCPLRRSSTAQCMAAGDRWVDEDRGGAPVPFHRRAPDWCALRSGPVEVRRG